MKLALGIFILFFTSFPGLGFQRNSSDSLLERGRLEFENQEWSAAQVYFDQWIQTHPTDQEALWLRGQAFQNQGNLDRALSDFSSLLVLNPSHAEAYFERGRVRYLLKQYEEAKVDFENYLKTPPGETTRILFKIAPGDNAVSSVTTAQSSSQEDAYYHLGLCSIALKEYDFALLYLDEAILLNPKIPDFHAEKGRALARLGDNVSSIEAYEIALRLDPDHLSAKQGLALVKTGGDEVLQEQLDQVIADSAANSQNYKQRGFYRMNHDDYAGAIADFSAAISLDASDSESYFYRGKIYYRQKNWENAEIDFSDAIAIEPENPEYYLARGQARYVSQNLDAAVADFTMTIFLDPEFASGFYHRGIANQRLGKVKEACPDLLKAKNLGMEEAETAWIKVCGTN
ncbi:tetratricopeptide repeat protein [Algoriphagus boritolerans]|uniref:Tfp pilus assembly protein PilF n=1 Tax=Algoriphagus boritolerans DSM 17298 = JCM 18970 TaxID=1120964 RepID=A0A1H5YLW0_9BACT|nr:tetratricopeptide repeat protein [Algoriphagus boritolerans]SEG25133.1 Tfp pilus assembly protein PilF [Algoriphagus boritolerans DSM 17298 = JCM 18970]